MHIHENMPLQSPNGMQSENERLEKRSFESVCIQTMTTTTTDDHGFNDIATMKMVTTSAITKTVETIALPNRYFTDGKIDGSNEYKNNGSNNNVDNQLIGHNNHS